MQNSTRGTRRPRATRLRVAELTVTLLIAALGGGALGAAVVAVDTVLLMPPPVELGTVESARALLAGIAGGLITVAVFSLWMRTVVVGLVADHFSPRTLTAFLEDRFQRDLLGSMAAGLTAVLVVLLGLPGTPEAPAPLLGTGLALVIALAALAAVLLAIQHATRSLSLPELVARLADDALEVLRRQPDARVELHETPPTTNSETVLAGGTGWVTDIELDEIMAALPPGGAAHLHTRVGAFVTHRSPVIVVSVADADAPADLERVRGAVTLARTRSPEMDLAFALGQLLDVGAYALQGSTDTATAHEVLVHLGALLEAVVEHGLPLRHDADADGRRVHDEAGWDAADHLQLCIERLRDAAARDPEAARHLLQMLGGVRRVADEVGDRAVASEVKRQGETLLELARASGMVSRDHQRLEREAEAIIDA